MFDNKHYVPTFRWKAGEQTALKELATVDKTTLTPLVEIPPIPWDFDDEQPAKPLDAHLPKMPPQIVAVWGTARPLFVDLGLLDDPLDIGGMHAVDWFHEQLEANGVKAIPVTAPGRDVPYQAAVRRVANRASLGVCVRVDLTQSFDPALSVTVAKLLEDLGVKPGDADIVFDLGAISADQVNVLRTATVG